MLPRAPFQPASDRVISAVSLNLAKETDSNTVVGAIRNVSRLRDADLFLFQEVANEKSNLSVAEKVACGLGYFVVFEQAAPRVYDQGLAVVSRYALDDVNIKRLKTCDLHFRCRSRFAIAAAVRTPWRDLRVWNAHLDTRINTEERVEQLQPVIDEAARYTGPRLIGGDFNTNELYWWRNMIPLPTGSSHGTAIRKAMKQHGFETPFSGALNTFPALRRQLDWIFVCDLIPLEASVEFVPFSDHNAIWMRFRL